MRSRYAFFLLCTILFIAPLPLGANRPWAWGMLEVLIAVNTLLVCYCHSFHALFTQLKKIRVPLTCLLLLQLWVLLQWLGGVAPEGLLHLSPWVSVDPAQSELSLLKGISFCLFMINVALLVNSEQRIKAVCWVIMIGGLVQAGYAIFLQYSGWSSSPLGFSIGQRATGSFVYQNHLASYLLLSLCVAIGYLIGSLTGSKAITQRTKWASIIETLLSSKWIVRICIVIMVVALIMTRSRMGNSAFFVSMLVSCLLALLIMKRPPNTLKWLIASLIILDVAIVGSYFGVEKVKERLQSTSFASETRDDVVRDAIPYLESVWITGSGAGSFYSSFQQYQTMPYSGFYDHAHNEYVQFVAEFGLLPSIMLFGMVLVIIWQNLTRLRTSTNKMNRGLALGCLMACVAMIMHCTVEFVLQNYAIVLLLLVVICLPSLNVKKGRSRLGS